MPDEIGVYVEGIRLKYFFISTGYAFSFLILCPLAQVYFVDVGGLLR